MVCRTPIARVLPAFLAMFDSHCHFQDPRIAHCVDSVVQEAVKQGVHHFAVNGTHPDDWCKVLELSRQHPQVVPNFGVHPWWLQSRGEDWQRKLREQLLATPHAGVGECGLDKGPKGLAVADMEVQEQVFVEHLRLAQELQRPVSVHCVRAFGPLQALLQREGGSFPAGVLLHSWSGSADVTRQLAAVAGVHFSLSGTLTSVKADKARQLVQAIPLDRLLVETDSPDGVMRCQGGGRAGEACPPAPALRHIPAAAGADNTAGRPLNHPANLGVVCEFVSNLLGLPPEQVADVTCKNGRRLFQV